MVNKDIRVNMRFRDKLIPRNWNDFGCFILLFSFAPLTLAFEVFVVLPEFHSTDGYILYILAAFGCFILFNVLANMLYCMLVDTSIKFEMLTPPLKQIYYQKWHFCVSCEVLVPPRAAHCKICRTCILKRDHHCHFTGCCIGHKNQRYFVLLMLYISIGSGIATLYNNFYFWAIHSDTYATDLTAIKMICPMLMFVLDISWQNLYLLIYELTFFAFLYSTVLLAYYAPTFFKGALRSERVAKYDQGFKSNMEMVFGKRMKLAWIAPFVTSDLPHDGIHWETVLQHTTKNR